MIDVGEHIVLPYEFLLSLWQAARSVRIFIKFMENRVFREKVGV